MVDIVTVKVDEVAAQIEGLLDNQRVWLLVEGAAETDEDLELCCAEYVANVISIGADFYRRFWRGVHCYPLLLLWVVFMPYNVPVPCKEPY
jgi:hypothetical protein